MTYSFPELNTIKDVIWAIEGREEFAIKEDHEHGYGVVNYHVAFEDTFPTPSDFTNLRDQLAAALRRECRGIKFDLTTLRIINRPYHKFFNVNERAETLMHSVDWAQPHVILEKLDGSMITPIVVNQQIRWCTKMGLTQIALQIDAHAKINPQYNRFAQNMLDAGLTPIFEWCSRQQRIVLDYPVDRLVLTAIRNIRTGLYLSMEAMTALAHRDGITDIVRTLPGSVENIQLFMEQARDVEGEEGYIIRFADGHMLKVKGAWYCQLHKTLDHLRFEKDVIRLIVTDNLDDAKPFLPVDLVEGTDRFARAIYDNLRSKAEWIFWTTQTAHDNLNGSKKRFVMEVANQHPLLFKLLTRCWDRLHEGEDGVYEQLKTEVLNATGTQNKVNAVRHLFGGATWDQFKPRQPTE